MSVIIRGMKMPKGCAFCKIPMRNGKKTYCPLVRCEWDFRDPMSAYHRLDGCPLGELPPHGRLIDADAFSDFIKEWGEDVPKDTAFWHILLLLGEAPTIIEAEEEKI